MVNMVNDQVKKMKKNEKRMHAEAAAIHTSAWRSIHHPLAPKQLLSPNPFECYDSV